MSATKRRIKERERGRERWVLFLSLSVWLTRLPCHSCQTERSVVYQVKTFVFTSSYSTRVYEGTIQCLHNYLFSLKRMSSREKNWNEQKRVRWTSFGLLKLAGGQHLEQLYVELYFGFLKFWILTERKMSYPFFLFSNFFFIYFSKLFEYWKKWWFIKFKISRILNFSNGKILKIYYFSKLNNFRNLMIFEIGKFGFLEFYKLKILASFKIAHFWNFQNWKFVGIFKIVDFSNFPNCRFFKFSKLKN